MHKPWLQFYEAGVAPSLVYPQTTLGHILAEAARTQPDDIASTFMLQYIGGRIPISGSLTYRQLDGLVQRFAAALRRLGLRKGDRVALLLPNSPQFVIAFFAALRLGALVVAINPTYTSRELQHPLTDSGAETLITLNRFWPRLAGLTATTGLRRVIVADIADLLPLPARLLVALSQDRRARQNQVAATEISSSCQTFLFEEMLRQEALQQPASPVQDEAGPEDVALLQYTGGTTGRPKAAMLTHRNLLANLVQIDAWSTDVPMGREKLLGAIPFFHAYGMTVAMLYAFFIRCELVIVPDPRQITHVLRTVHNERCSLLPGVPALYRAINDHPDAARYDLRCIRVCISGAAPLPAEVQTRFEALTGGRLVEGYGLSEASPVTHCNPIYGHRKPGIGVPLSDVEARLIDLETGVDLGLAAGRPGELYVRGPQVMRGYWNQPDETASTLDQDGWLRTGDICVADADGFFSLVDRRKDMIIVGGFKVLPHEVEEVLALHPDVQEVAVAGIPHPTRGDETVKAYVVRRPGSTLTADELLALCRQSLAPYKRPRQITFRTELPRTLVGKVLRRTLVAEERELVADT